jgi:hypothetical protein
MITNIAYRYSSGDGFGDWRDPETGEDWTLEAVSQFNDGLTLSLQKRFPGAKIDVRNDPPKLGGSSLLFSSDDGFEEDEDISGEIMSIVEDAFTNLCDTFTPPKKEA